MVELSDAKVCAYQPSARTVLHISADQDLDTVPHSTVSTVVSTTNAYTMSQPTRVLLVVDMVLRHPAHHVSCPRQDIDDVCVDTHDLSTSKT